MTALSAAPWRAAPPIVKVAFRNILRNGRRSAMTAAAISVGAVAMLIAGGFMAFILATLDVAIIRSNGHFTVFRAGYFTFGAGNPAAYGIADEASLTRLILEDPVAGPLVRVATPVVRLFGIAGNPAIDASKTFYGVGFVPSGRDRMRQWDEYDLIGRFGLAALMPPVTGMRDDDPTLGMTGLGLARILGLCVPLHLGNCPAPRAGPPGAVADPATSGERPRLDLLAAATGGAPNVVSLAVGGAQYQSPKELDDAFVGMPLAMAQQLLYGRGERQVTGLVLQLWRTADMAPLRARLEALFAAKGLGLELRDFTELVPLYNEVNGLFSAVFAFMATVIGVIVLFTVVNTMSMSVMERTSEIGALRALGVRRSGIRRQFIVEGCLLGVIGATFGVILAYLVAFLVNRAGLTWVPPGQGTPIPLRVLMSGVWSLLLGSWLGLVVIAAVASLIPAQRAARMAVVDALRHV